MPNPTPQPAWKRLISTLWHLLLTPLRTTAPAANPTPKRILLLNGAHIGDIIIATSFIPVLKSAYPEAEIGFVTGSWSLPAVSNHPGIQHNHFVDHWRMNRSSAGLLAKLQKYWKTRSQTLRELRNLNYDIAISLHPWHSDFLNLSWQAKIPVRAAFTRSLWAPLATVLAHYPEENLLLHHGACQENLFRALGIGESHIAKRKSTLAPPTEAALAEVSSLLGVPNLSDANYTVIHMGAGAPGKEMPVAFWREMAETLSPSAKLVFTGLGEREAANINTAIAGLPNCCNLCGKLSWGGFIAAISQAKTFYGLDSMAAHVAAAVGTKCVAVFSGTGGVSRWRPEAQNAIVWSTPVPCSPCFLKNGCPEMRCMRGITPSMVIQHS